MKLCPPNRSPTYEQPVVVSLIGVEQPVQFKRKEHQTKSLMIVCMYLPCNSILWFHSISETFSVPIFPALLFLWNPSPVQSELALCLVFNPSDVRRQLGRGADVPSPCRGQQPSRHQDSRSLFTNVSFMSVRLNYCVKLLCILCPLCVHF